MTFFVPQKKLNYTPSWVKVKYGAWYLDPKTWKVQERNKPLLDPRDIEDKEMSEAKKKSKNLVRFTIFLTLNNTLKRETWYIRVGLKNSFWCSIKSYLF